MNAIVRIFQSYRDNLSSEKVNTGRQREVDFARGLAVLFMILVHVLGIYGTEGVQGSVFGYVIDFLGSPPAAPVFMLLMGLSIAFSKRMSPKTMALRGIRIFLLGYGLSFIRYVLPMMIGLRSNIFSPEDLEAGGLLTMLIEVDIFQLAGLSLIFLSFLEGLKVKKTYYLIIAIVVSLASPLLWGLKTNTAPIDFLLDPLWGNADHVSFPLFSWSFYPLIGVYLGNHLIRAKDKRIFYKGVALCGLTLLVIGSLVSLTNMDLHIGDYWRHGIGGNLWFTGFVLVWLALLFAALNKFSIPHAIADRINFWSRNVTPIYIIHWIIIGWSTLLLGLRACRFLQLSY